MNKSSPAAPRRSPSRLAAVLFALLITFLWSTSWVLIKLGMNDSLPAVTFAGLRYTLAWLSLAPFVLFSASQRAELRALPRADWLNLAGIGVVVYTLTQGAQYLSLEYLPAVSTSLVLHLSGIVVAFLGIAFLREIPSFWQWGGVILATGGMLLYFLPAQFPAGEWLGLFWAVVCMLANSASSILTRQVNNNSRHSTLAITFVSMGAGSLLMFALGLVTQGIGTLTTNQWLILLWLAVVNTAFCFTLWNYTLRTLRALEASILLNLMVPQVALMAWLFLGEGLSGKQIAGLLLVGVGTVIVQLRFNKKAAN